MKIFKNSADLIVITSYPEKGETHGEKTVGIASYTKNTLKSILQIKARKDQKPKIVVIAEKLTSGKKDIYHDDGVEVRRVWQRNSLFYSLEILRELMFFPRTKKILLEFELSMFGRVELLAFVPILLAVFKILRKKVFIVSHQVVDDINVMSGHVGIEEDSVKAYLVNVLIHLFYKLTYGQAYKVIVFEQELKEKLARVIQSRKITVIPHGIEKFDKIAGRKSAREKLQLKNEFVILYFGYLTWYKGADWLVDKLKAFGSHLSGREIKLIVAGGANPNHTDKPHYQNYIKSIEKAAISSDGKIVITGIVKEEDISLYFTASDLVVLPYRVFMSSSGPLSLACSFDRPFLTSDVLGDIFKTKDIEKIADDLDIVTDDIIFELSDGSFENRLKRLIQHKNNLKKLTKFSSELKRARLFEKIGEIYHEEVLSC